MKKRIIFATMTLFSLLILGSIYSDRISSQSRDVYILEAEKQILDMEIKELELLLSTNCSLESISSRAQELGMVSQRETWFIKPSGSLSLR